MSHSRTTSQSSPHLEIPGKSTELQDPGAHSLSSEDEYYSDASEGKEKTARSASPIPKTRVERVDDAPAYGEVPGTPAYDKRARDAVPDEVEVVPEGRLSKRSSQLLDPTTPGGSAIPRTVVEKLDPAEAGYGDDPNTRAFQHRKADSVPDVVMKAPQPGKRRKYEDEPSSAASPNTPIPETVITKVDTRPSHGEEPGTDAYDKRRMDASADAVEKVEEAAGFDRTVKSARRRSTMKSSADNGPNNETDFGDDFDDFEEGAQAGVDDDFGDFDDGFEQPETTVEEPSEMPPQTTYPLIDVDALSSLPDLLAATKEQLDHMFPSTTEEILSSLPRPEPIDTTSPIFPSERSRSLWKQLVTPPPLQPPNWTQSRIRRLFLVSLGVPVDLDEILPPSKQKKLILPDINLETSRKSESDKTVGSIARLKQQAANDSSASLESNQSGTKDSKLRGRRQKGPPPPPELDLSAVRRLCATTDEKLDGFTDEEIEEHIKQLEHTSEKTSAVLEYWLKRRDGLRKEKEAFEGVIENLVAHVRRVRR